MKYLKKFKSLTDANEQGRELHSPHIDIIEGMDVVNYMDIAQPFKCRFSEDGTMQNVRSVNYIPDIITELDEIRTGSGEHAGKFVYLYNKSKNDISFILGADTIIIYSGELKSYLLTDIKKSGPMYPIYSTDIDERWVYEQSKFYICSKYNNGSLINGVKYINHNESINQEQYGIENIAESYLQQFIDTIIVSTGYYYVIFV